MLLKGRFEGSINDLNGGTAFIHPQKWRNASNTSDETSDSLSEI